MRPQPGQAVTLGENDAEAERLQQLARRVDLLAAVAAGLRRQRDADRVADPFVEQDAHRGADQTSPLVPMPASVSPRCSG